MKRIFALLIALMPITAIAQERDSVFSDYTAYERFVDDHIMKRDFIPLVLALGGRDEYSEEQLHKVNQNLMAAFPIRFVNKTKFRETHLGGGMRQEGRAYWTGESYAYFYALLHDRGKDLVVVNFHLNSSVAKVIDKF